MDLLYANFHTDEPMSRQGIQRHVKEATTACQQSIVKLFCKEKPPEVFLYFHERSTGTHLSMNLLVQGLIHLRRRAPRAGHRRVHAGGAKREPLYHGRGLDHQQATR